MVLTSAGCGSQTGSQSVGGAAGSVSGGAATGGGASGGAAAAGGVAVPTEVTACKVEFVPDTGGPTAALGMVWGGGRITFDVGVDCTKAITSGALTYHVFYTGTGARQDLAPAPHDLAGVTSAHFPYVIGCKAGTYVFEYQFQATVDKAAAEKQDANSGSGVLLTSANCR